MKKLLCVAVSSWVAVLGSCEGGTEVGNPIVDVGFAAYRLSSSNVRAAGRIDVDAAWLAFRELKLRPSDNCEERAQLEVTGPLAVDLLGPIPPPLRDLETPAGGYCRIELRWHKVSTPIAGAPAELDGVAVYVSGTRRDGKRFIIRSERNDALELRARGGAFQLDTSISGLIVGFDMQAWLSGVDLDGAVVGAGDVIRVEQGQNEAQLTRFEQNVAASAKLFEDQDGDERLGENETDDRDALGDGASR